MRKELADVVLLSSVRPALHWKTPWNQSVDYNGLALHQNGTPSMLPQAQARHLSTGTFQHPGDNMNQGIYVASVVHVAQH